jgi:hypothetical protein
MYPIEVCHNIVGLLLQRPLVELLLILALYTINMSEEHQHAHLNGYSTSNTVSVSEYSNRIFLMSISNRILSGMVHTIHIRI